ncbi:MAG TPA: alkaline phosphatase family protein [Streptosporangiaceae bacterium]|jgi:phospholipase C|nr:alkaline phosphatase family protein [Streptosporangiaceae bacterium]
MTGSIFARPRLIRLAVAAALILFVLASCTPKVPRHRVTPPPAGIHKIKHVVIITQENRSFDSNFGTYPRADGIPMRGRTPAVCVPNPAPAS